VAPGRILGAYLIRKVPLNLEELRPAEPYSNPLVGNCQREADAIKWNATFRDWETLARILHLRTKVALPSPLSLPLALPVTVAG